MGKHRQVISKTIMSSYLSYKNFEVTTPQMGVIPSLVKRLGKELISFTTGKINSFSFLKKLSGIYMHMFFTPLILIQETLLQKDSDIFTKRSGENIHCDFIYSNEELKIRHMSTNKGKFE